MSSTLPAKPEMITLAGEDRPLALRIKELTAVASLISTPARRVSVGEYISEVMQGLHGKIEAEWFPPILTQALVGGGMDPLDAGELVRVHTVNWGLADWLKYCRPICMSAVVGYHEPDDAPASPGAEQSPGKSQTPST